MRSLLLSLDYLIMLLKARLAYRADFFVQVGSDLLLQAVDLVFLMVLFSRVRALAGWSFDEALFIYGFFLIPFALFNATFAALSALGARYIVRGDLDRVLVRPMNSFLQVQLELLRPQALNGVLLGLVVIAVASVRLGLSWSAPGALAATAGVVGAWLVYGGVYIAVASVNFWTQDRAGLFPIAYNLITFGRYPLTIYPAAIRFLLTFVLPYGFLAFYPAAGLIREEFRLIGLMTPVVGVISLTVGLNLWRQGLKRYEGAGS
ncbi:MAG: ABC-2 family transporter protein [Deinococcota bacterium]|jgi:ABC-2 type transport system permease protein|nr:ABC-2 family transporter protein [Deinococcota bacterium]